VPGFYNENANRAFPFRVNNVDDPTAPAGPVTVNSVIVDAGFMIGAGSGFVDGVNSIWLDSVSRTGGEFVFSFASDAPGLYGKTLEFTRQVTDPEYLSSFDINVIDVPYVKMDSISIYDPDPVTACFFLGDSGTVTFPRGGRIKFYFNDSFFPDNTGSFTLIFAGQTYIVPCTENGIDGPRVTGGIPYSYSATGEIMYRPHSDPANDEYATPNGAVKAPYQIAPGVCPCPGSRYYGLVAKLLEDVDNSESPVTSESLVYPDQSLWNGYLVTGSMAALAAQLPDDGTLTRVSGGLVEPALIQNLDGSHATTLNLANIDRTRVTAADGCPELSWPYPVGPDVIYPVARGLSGAIQFEAGYNASLLPNKFNNAIVLGAVAGAGKGQPCNEVRRFPGEVQPNAISPGDLGFLDGSSTCNGVLRSINGAGGPYLQIIAGNGVEVTADIENNTLTVDVNLANLQVCGVDVSEISETL